MLIRTQHTLKGFPEIIFRDLSKQHKALRLVLMRKPETDVNGGNGTMSLFFIYNFFFFIILLAWFPKKLFKDNLTTSCLIQSFAKCLMQPISNSWFQHSNSDIIRRACDTTILSFHPLILLLFHHILILFLFLRLRIILPFLHF